MKPVLFASTKPYARAENIRAVYEAYDGEKAFVQVDPWRKHPEITSGRYDLMVIDEFPTVTPGKCIRIEHGIDGGKTVGLDQPHPYYHADQADLITCYVNCGTNMTGHTAKMCGIPEERVLPLGMPRTDVYRNAKKGDGGTVLATKRSYLYAPTYRSAEETPLPDIDWEWLDGQLTDDELIAVKTHTMTGKILKKAYRHIMEFEPYEPSAAYLIDCDVVITDYSTILFDGYLLRKPGVLFEKQEGYTQTRGMYLDYPKQYCSRYCTNEQELLKTVREAENLTVTEYGVLRLVADRCDGHATERVCDLIRKMNEG